MRARKHTHRLAVCVTRTSTALQMLLLAKVPADSAVRLSSVCSEQDLSRWQSRKTGRGPLKGGWRDDSCTPIMCSYKRVQCSFEVYGFQSKTEEFIHKVRGTTAHGVHTRTTQMAKSDNSHQA